MKYRLCVLMCITALLAAPCFAVAQAPLQGLPNVGKIWDFKNLPNFTPPTFYAGYSSRDIEFDYVNELNFQFTAVAKGIKFDFKQSSFVFGAQEAIPFDAFNGNLGLFLSAWFHLPLTEANAESSSLILQTQNPFAPGPDFFLNHEWDASGTWWFIDAIAAYRIGSNFAALAGFRYDQEVISFKDPSFDPSPISYPDQESDITQNAYVPLIGAMWAYDGPRTKLSAAVIGSPLIFGDVDYNLTNNPPNFPPGSSYYSGRTSLNTNYKNAYFIEFGMNYSYNMWGSDIGMFGKYHLSSIEVGGDLDQEIVGGPSDVTPGEEGGGMRKAWTVGGSLNIPFNLNMPFI